MHKAELGDRVQIEYSHARERKAGQDQARLPKKCEFTVGSKDVFPGLSLGVVGMAPGDRKLLTLQPHEAFGPVKPNLIREIPRQRLPQHIALQVGKRLTAFVATSGRRERVRIVKVNLESVTVDGNHPLAGKVIELEVNLISLDSSSTAKKRKPQLDRGGRG